MTLSLSRESHIFRPDQAGISTKGPSINNVIKIINFRPSLSSFFTWGLYTKSSIGPGVTLFISPIVKRRSLWTTPKLNGRLGLAGHATEKARSTKNVKKPQIWCDCHRYGLWEHGTIVICELSYLAFLLKIFLPKLSNSRNQQQLSKGTKLQTSSFSFF